MPEVEPQLPPWAQAVVALWAIAAVVLYLRPALVEILPALLAAR